MAREAELHDGTILEFPDDTPDDVIQRTVKRHLGVPDALAPRDPSEDELPGDDTPIAPQTDSIQTPRETRTQRRRREGYAQLHADAEAARQGEPGADELASASRPARITLKDGRRPVLEPQFAPEIQQEAGSPEPVEPGVVEHRRRFRREGLLSRPVPELAPLPQPAELTEDEAAQPTRMVMTRAGQPYRAGTPKPFEKSDLPPDWHNQMQEYEFALDERPKPAWYDWAKRNAGMLEQSQVEKGISTGGIGAKQMGAAAMTVPVIGAMKTLAAELNAYDRIDRENQFAVPKGEGMTYVAGKARMYLASDPETRTRLRQQALERFAAHGETKDQLVAAWRAYERESKQYMGRTVNLTDVGDVQGFADWFFWNFGQALPYMGALAMMGVIGGALGGPAGATLGVGGGSYVMGVGDIHGEGIRRGIEDQTGRAALVGGVPYAGLDVAFGPIASVLRSFRNVSRGALQQVAREYWKRAGKAVPTDMVGEFMNEAGQEIIKDGSIISVTGEPLVTDESLKRWLNSGAAGMPAGGIGGAARAIPGQPAQPRVTSRDATQPGVTSRDTGFVRQEPAGTPPPAPPPGPDLQGRVEPTVSAADLERVVADTRPARDIVRDEDRAAAAERVEPTAQAVQRDEEGRAARADELGLPHEGDRMTVEAPAGAVTGVVESAQPTEAGWELRIRDDDGELHVFNESDRVQISTPARRGDGTKEDPVRVTASAQIAEARAQIDPAPTPGQKEAENYSMGHIVFDEGHPYHGLPEISLETAKGGTRVAKDGSWSVPNFPADYGRFKGTEGMDGDHVDVMLGDGGRIFIIDQVNAETGAADEHKVMLGYPTPKAARDVYIAAYTDAKGPERIGAITAIGVEELKAWLADRARTKKPYGEISTPEEWLEEAQDRWDQEQPLAGYAEDLEHDLKHASDPGWRPAMREALRRLRARIRHLQLGEGEPDARQVRKDERQIRGRGRPAAQGGQEQGRPDLQRTPEARPGAGDAQPPEQRREPAQPDQGEAVLESAEDRKRWNAFQLADTPRVRAAGVKPVAPYIVDRNGIRLRKAKRKEKLAAGETLVWGFVEAQTLRSKRLKAYWRARRRPDRSKDSLIEWIAKTGGMSMEEREDTAPGENRVFNVSQWLFTKKGKAADELATAAFYDGYLSKEEHEDVDGGVQALRDKIADEFADRRKHYSSWRDPAADLAEAHQDEVLLAADALGISIEGKSLEEIEKLVNEAEAVEQAIVEVDADPAAAVEAEAVRAQNLTPEEPHAGTARPQPAEPSPGARQEAAPRGEPRAPQQPVGKDKAEVGAPEGRPGKADQGARAAPPVETEGELQGTREYLQQAGAEISDRDRDALSLLKTEETEAEREARLEREAIHRQDEPLESRGRRVEPKSLQQLQEETLRRMAEPRSSDLRAKHARGAAVREYRKQAARLGYTPAQIEQQVRDLWDMYELRAASEGDEPQASQGGRRPDAEQAAIEKYGLPADTVFEAGRFGPLTKGKVRAVAAGVESNWRDTQDAAAADLKGFLDARAEGEARGARLAAAHKALADKLRRGEKPTMDEWRAGFPSLRPHHTYLRQPEISPFLVEHFGFKRHDIKSRLGKAAGTLSSDTGATYPIVYFNRLAEVLKAGDTVSIPEDSSAKVSVPGQDGPQGRLFESRGRTRAPRRDNRPGGGRTESLVHAIAAIDNMLPWYEARGAAAAEQVTQLKEKRAELQRMLDDPQAVFYEPPVAMEEAWLEAFKKNQRLHAAGKFLESPFDDDAKERWPEKWFNRLRDAHGENWKEKAAVALDELELDLGERFGLSTSESKEWRNFQLGMERAVIRRIRNALARHQAGEPEPQASRGRAMDTEPRNVAELAGQVEALEKAVERAYEKHSPAAEDLDALLTELQDELAGAYEEQVEDEASADLEPGSLDEKLREAYGRWLRGDEEERSHAVAAMHNALNTAGARKRRDDQALEAAGDAYAAAVARRVRRVQVHGGTAYEETQDGPVLVAREVAIVQPSKWEPGATTYDFYIHTILDRATGKDIGRITLGWKNGKIMVLPAITLWEGSQGHWRGRGRGEAVVRALLEHNGEGHELTIAYIADAAMGFWRKLGTDVYDTGEGKDGSLTLEAYRDARARGARPGAPRDAVGEAGAPQDARAREAHGEETPGLSRSRVIELLVEAFGPGVHALIDSDILELAATPAQLPANLRKTTGDATEAWYDRKARDGQGKAWLILSHLDADRVVPVFLHEIGEHHGLKRILGADGYKQLQETVRNLAKTNPVVKAAWEHVEREYRNLDPDGERFVSEVIARVGETEEGMRQPFMRRLINAVREFLIRLGLQAGLVAKISDRDIVLLVQAAARRVVEEAEAAAERAVPREYPAQASKGGLFGRFFGDKEEPAPASPGVGDKIEAQPGAEFRRLNQLLGAKLYGEPRDLAPVSVKEMLQNAFDAIKTVIDRGEATQGAISITVDTSARTITVQDNGSGMTPTTLATSFLRLAGTLKETGRSSGGLGIAKGLFLYGNKRIRVETWRDGKKSILDTSGADLLAAADGTGDKPTIKIKRADESMHGSTVKVWLPEDYVDASRGQTVPIYMSGREEAYPVLNRSPLFSNITVTFNGKVLPNIGATFQAQAYSVYARVTFNWGEATVYVSKGSKDVLYGSPNVHNLSNGLWQFSQYLPEDPLSVGKGVPRQIYVDVHPRVQPEESGYPFSLNRQEFSGQTKSDFDKLLTYLTLAYRREITDAQAQNFGQIRYLEGGKAGAKQLLAPERGKDFAKNLLRIVEGDEVTIEEGRLIVNGREIPHITPDDLDKAKLSLSDFVIDQRQIKHDQVMLHDNTQRGGELFSDLMRERFGPAFDRLLDGFGKRFIGLRELFVEKYPAKYLGLADYAVGVSFDKNYHGVLTNVPFKGVFVNPVNMKDVDGEVLGNEIFGTMVHELVHHKERGHGPDFINELQRMYSEVLSSAAADALREDLVNFVKHNAALLKALSEEFSNENLSLVGNSLEGEKRERGQGADTRASAAIDGRAPGEDDGGGGAARAVGVDRFVSAPGEEAGPVEDEPQASQGGAAHVPPPAPDQFQLTALETIQAEPPNRDPGDRHWIGDISLFTKLAIHPRMLASLEPSFVPVYRTAEAQIEDRDQIAHELAKRIDVYMRLPEDSKTKVNSVLELDRLAEKVHLAGKEMSAKNESFRTARLSKVGDTIKLNDEEKTAYWAVRRMLDIALKMFRDQLLAELGVDASKFKGGDLAAKILDAINPAMTEEQKENYQKAAKFAHEIEQARRRGYVPFTRWGNVVIAVKNADGDVIWAEKIEVDPVEFHKRGVAVRFGRKIRDMPSVARALANVEKLFPSGKVSVFQIPEGAGTAETHPDIGQLDELAKIAGIEPAEWDGVRAKLEQALKAKGFRKHFLGSTNVPGYSADFERAIADYVTGMAGYLARRKHREGWDDAIAGIPAVKRRLQAYARKYHEYMQSPQEEMHLLRQVGFIYYLGLIPASAIANGSQIPLVTAPYLSQFANPAIVAGELTRAIADVGLMYRPIDSGFEMFDPAAAPEDVREALQEAWARGFFVPLQTYEVQGVAYGRTPYGRKAKRALRDTRDGIAYMFSLAERTNRLTSFIAAYRLSKRAGFKERVHEVLGDNPLAKAEILGESWSPERFGSWTVDETQFRMGKVNRPPIGRGYGAAILQFKGFMMQMIELWYRMAVQNGVHGKTAFASSLLLWMLVAGFWGLPGADDLRDLWEKLYRMFTHTDLDTKARAREWVYKVTGSAKLAEMFTRGAPAGAGFDLSGRVGMGNIAPDSPLQVAGIPADITAGRAMRAVEYAANDSPELAWAEALPNFLKNAITGASWLAQGVRNRRGDVVIPREQIGVTDAILRGFVGVTPTWISNRRDLYQAQHRVETAINEKRDDFYERMAKARADLIRAERAKDKAAAGDAAKRIREQSAALAKYNEGKEPQNRIALDHKALERRVTRELQGGEAQRGKGRVAARPRREQLREVYGVK